MTEPGSVVADVRATYARRDQEVPADRYARTTARELCGQHERELWMMVLLRNAGLGALTGKRVLDVGCGRGMTLRLLLEYGAQPEDLFGIDLLEDRIAAARNLNSAINFQCADATRIPFPDTSFDLLVQFTSFSSMLDPATRRSVASEMHRVLAPGGSILWYDLIFDNPRNYRVRALKPREISCLFPGYRVVGRRVTLAPPLGRIVAKMSYSAYHLLTRIQFLCTHYICLAQKP